MPTTKTTFLGRSFNLSFFFFSLVAASPISGAELSVEYTAIARTGVTPVPASVGSFSNLGSTPAIDTDGNVVLVGSGSSQVGVYTFINGAFQRVADLDTPIPGGGGATFSGFNWEEVDIDGGRVAFKSAFTVPVGVYSNVGQANPGNLVELLVLDGIEWSEATSPWVDGDVVAIQGQRLIPQTNKTILRWNGTNFSEEFVDPGVGNVVGYYTQASISGDATIFIRGNSNGAELTISDGGSFETLVEFGATPMPGLPGINFAGVFNYAVIDWGGLDAAFLGYGNQKGGVYKRVNGGALTKVTDTTTAIPGAPGDQFKFFPDEAIALANGKVAFMGVGQGLLDGIYTDVGGEVDVIVDDQANNTIQLDGQPERVVAMTMGSKSFAYTANGYEVVFKAYFESGGSAIVRATITDGAPPPSLDLFTVFKDFSDNNTASVSISLSCTSGTVSNNPQLASESSPAIFAIEGASPGATCTAVESVPSGYTANQADCQNGDPLNGSCTIVNTQNLVSGSFTVFKDFSDNNTASVSISLSCTSGTVSNNPQLASESSPAIFAIEGASPGATCTAVESVPANYTANQADCQNGDPLNGSCTIVNTQNLISGSFTVFKDFSDNNTASVSISLSCTSGTVTNSPRLAREGAPAVFNISGASPGTTCTATEPSVPAGYTRNQTDCQNGDPLNGNCTIINTLDQPSSNSFTVYKDFSDNNTASVSISLSCTSGTVSNSPQLASESSPAIFAIEGASPGATCTAVESVPSGYTANQADCQNGDPLNGSCTIVNTVVPPSSDTFKVFKDFSDNNTASVSIILSCSSGSVTNNPQLASESSPANFNITGAASGTKCTAIESPVPAGYTASDWDCQKGRSINGYCTIVNNKVQGSDSFTVYKDFSDNSTASVSISLSCTSGTVTNSPQLAGEGAPAVFNISGASPGTTCTATEPSVPAGYTRNQTDCQNGDPLNGNCTIINTLDQPSSNSFTVYKDFSDNNTASVSISLSCTSGTVTNSPRLAREGAPAVFNISGASPGTTCTATEPSVPAGYTRNQTDCQNGDPLNGNCTIINTLDQPSSNSFTVYKDFSDNNTASVSISLSCTSGTVTNSPRLAREGAPAVFSISGASPGTTCTATEPSVPAGYIRNQTDCQDGDSLDGNCTIINTLNTPPGEEEVIVWSDFEGGNTSGWSLSGNVSIDGILAVGQYSLRHGKNGLSEMSISTVGYQGVTVAMSLAGTSMKRNDNCYAEVSVDGGGTWLRAVTVISGNDNGNFYSGSLSRPGASDNPDLRLRFVYEGKGKGGYCYGDEVIVMGSPIGN